ncbi:hypothetical protein STEG23_017031 [Scotinomys teguina]
MRMWTKSCNDQRETSLAVKTEQNAFPEMRMWTKSCNDQRETSLAVKTEQNSMCLEECEYLMAFTGI